ncbi:MAG TPA: glutamate racemase [Actinomycetota bacterium]|nr:glutamate racemase [Actinomycetota bacterium]
MTDPRPIGVFDSGVGGLTVVRSIMDDLPHESVVYFGDTARYPYGPKPLSEIRGYAVEIARHLLRHDVKLIVVACNSATAAALDDVREAVPVPVVGVIEPAVRAAARATRNDRVGVIGTEATVASGAYQRALAKVAPEVQLVARACPRFVEFVERGDTTSPELLATANRYLAPLKEAGVDTLILGCTHYPLLRGAIQHVMGPGVLLLSSADETASDVYDVLAREGLLADGGEPVHRFECSGDPAWFAVLGRRFLGPEFTGAERVVPEPVGG